MFCCLLFLVSCFLWVVGRRRLSLVLVCLLLFIVVPRLLFVVRCCLSFGARLLLVVCYVL